MKENVYQSGNTIRLECIFYDFEKKMINPNNVKLTIYDYRYNIIHSGIVVNDSLGKYHCDYVTQLNGQKLYYEWYGEIDGKPSIKRSQIVTKFI